MGFGTPFPRCLGRFLKASTWGSEGVFPKQSTVVRLHRVEPSSPVAMAGISVVVPPTLPLLVTGTGQLNVFAIWVMS